MLTLGSLRQRRDEHPSHLTLLTWIVIAILAVFLCIRFFDWINDEPRSLLPVTEALVILDDLEALKTIAPLPTSILDAELYTAGIYRVRFGEIPEGSVSVVYVKNGWRFVEIQYLPGISSTQYLATHRYPTQEIKLDQTHSLWIQRVDDNPRCIDYEDDAPNRCEISRHLIGELGERLLLIAADGERATDGELIELARSIIDGVGTR
jgi:hypothetical protein